MPEVLCNQERCQHNKDWRCSLDKIHIIGEYEEVQRTSGFYYAKCRDFREIATKKEEK